MTLIKTVVAYSQHAPGLLKSLANEER